MDLLKEISLRWEKAYGHWILIIGFCLTLFTNEFCWVTKVPIAYFLIGLTFLFPLTIAITYVISVVKLKKEFELPRIFTVHSDKAGSTVCIATLNKILSFDSLVSIYYIDQNSKFEEFLGIGKVYNISEAKYCQIVIEYMVTTTFTQPDLVEKFKHNNNDILKNTIVKPTIPKPYLKYLSCEV